MVPYFNSQFPTMKLMKNVGMDHTDWIRPTIVAEISLFSASKGRVGYITEKTKNWLQTWSSKAKPWQRVVLALFFSWC